MTREWDPLLPGDPLSRRGVVVVFSVVVFVCFLIASVFVVATVFADFVVVFVFI